MDLSLFLPPLVACLVIVAIHSYLGLHVIAREVIFVDLSLAQMAALGSTVAILAGSQPDSHHRAALRARLHHPRRGALRPHAEQREGAGAAGGDHRHRVRHGIGGGDPGGRPHPARRRGDQGHPGGQPAVGDLADDHPAGRRSTRSSASSTGCCGGAFSRSRSSPRPRSPTGWRIRWWDFLFYLSFGIVITFSVPIAGVLLVFCFLVVPAAIAFQFTRRHGALAAISWVAGALASALGLLVSFEYDLPTGPVVVCMFGLLLLATYLMRRAWEGGLTTLSSVGGGIAARVSRPGLASTLARTAAVAWRRGAAARSARRRCRPAAAPGPGAPRSAPPDRVR